MASTVQPLTRIADRLREGAQRTVRRLLVDRPQDRRPRPARTAIGSDVARVRLRAASAGLLVVGLAALATGVWSSALSGDTVPRAVSGQDWTALPRAGIFGGQVAVYGHLTTEQPPSAEQLGCTLAASGQAAAGGLTRDGVTGLDRLVLEGNALVPLLVVTRQADTVRCTGPAAATSRPLYVVVQRGVDDMVPMAAYSLTSLALVIGVAGIVLLRPGAR